MIHRRASVLTHVSSFIWSVSGLDAHADTPVKILHVVLLGFIKYFWRDVIRNQLGDKAANKAKLIARLNSLDVSGLNISPVAGRTLVNYSGSLVGLDFCVIAQVAPFVLYDLVDPACYDAWVALSKLVPLIWQAEIGNIEAYTVSRQPPFHCSRLELTVYSCRFNSSTKLHSSCFARQNGPRNGSTNPSFTSSFTSQTIFAALGLPFSSLPRRLSHSTP